MNCDDTLANSVRSPSIAACNFTPSPREYDLARIQVSLADDEVQWWAYSIGGPLVGMEYVCYMVTPTVVIRFSERGVEVVKPHELPHLVVDRKINVCVDVKEVPIFPDARYRMHLDASKVFQSDEND